MEIVSERSETTAKQNLAAGIRFTVIGKLYHFDTRAFPELQVGDYVIAETVHGRQMGQIMAFTVGNGSNKYKPILRPASPRDHMLRQQWQAEEAAALEVCVEKARSFKNLSDAKFVAANYNYDGSRLTFLLTAEDKMDTNRLVKQLNQEFEAKVATRQIGPRDVAKLTGGFGACGELRCCSTFLTDFSPISIKMAKAQGISLNPSEITGMCGRLRCCLVYEYEQYVKARKQLPKRNKQIGTPFGKGRVVDVYPLKDAVAVLIDRETGVKVVPREELIPLEELEALAKKAKEPCDKHGDEPCDCGKQPGERNADQL